MKAPHVANRRFQSHNRRRATVTLVVLMVSACVLPGQLVAESSQKIQKLSHECQSGKQKACSELAKIPAFSDDINDAARGGDLGKVLTLLKGNPVLVFSKDKDGKTPLHWAAAKAHQEVAALLLANKADINARDKDGETPLHWAAIHGNKDVAKFLLANGAEVNARNNWGVTPLHWAAGHYGGLKATGTWRNCCWPMGPTSMARIGGATRLCSRR